jgi:hypothetical protein
MAVVAAEVAGQYPLVTLNTSGKNHAFYTAPEPQHMRHAQTSRVESRDSEGRVRVQLFTEEE